VVERQYSPEKSSEPNQEVKETKSPKKRRREMADLLEKFSSHLPARRESEQEPTEPSERFEDRSIRGKSVDEVVQPREREYAEPTETTEGTPTSATGKRRFVIGGMEYALDARQQGDLLEYAIKQYAIQQQAAAQAQAATQAQAAPPAVTNEAIAKVYDSIAQSTINELVEKRLLDEDLAELYQRSVLTFTGQAKWLADRSFDQEAKLNQMIETVGALIQRFESTLAWIHQHKVAIEGEQETPKRQGRQFVTGGKSGALLNKMVANSGRIR
jgi:hypothetical protein